MIWRYHYFRKHPYGDYFIGHEIRISVNQPGFHGNHVHLYVLLPLLSGHIADFLVQE